MENSRPCCKWLFNEGVEAGEEGERVKPEIKSQKSRGYLIISLVAGRSVRFIQYETSGYEEIYIVTHGEDYKLSETRRRRRSEGSRKVLKKFLP